MRVFSFPKYSVKSYPTSHFKLLARNCILMLPFVSSLASALAINKEEVALVGNSSALRFSNGRDGHSDSKPEAGLLKRVDNGRFTFYETGLGACGGWNNPTDYQWDGGSHCWEQITITQGDKTTQAQIVDLCPGCEWGALDMSPGLFSFFASQDLGVIYGTWDYGTGQAPTQAPASPALPLPSPLPVPELAPSPQPLPQPQEQTPPQPPQSTETPKLDTTVPVSTTSTSSTSVTTTATPTLQTNTAAPARPSQEGANVDVDPDDDEDDENDSTLDEDEKMDEAESAFFQYLTGGDDTDPGANNLQELNLAIVNLILSIHEASTPSVTV